LAVTHPDRIDRLALLCTSPGGEMPSYPLHELVALEPAERAEVRVPLLDTRYTPEWLAEHPDQQAFVDLLTRVPAEAPPAEQLRGEWEQLDARRRHDVVERLGAITCPTLVASGRFDGIAPLANGEAIAERVPTAELRAYDGGHLFMVQDKRAIPEILEFLAG
jgi:pimeloyl-ACP methyl ester carboxylesterase